MSSAPVMREDDIRPKPLLDEFFRKLRIDAERLADRRHEFVEVPCPMCGDAAQTPTFEKEGFPYASCNACGSLFASPRPTADALARYAADSEAIKYWSTHFYKQTADARRAQIFRPRAALVADLARDGTMAAGGRFVDVGAGYGLFLQELRELDVFGDLTGIEPDPRLAGTCRSAGFEVIEQPIEDIPPGAVEADVAAAFEVLEHVFDPCAFLEACARVLKPGGTLLFTTLTISGFDLQVLWEASRSISPPQHLNFGSVEGIERLIVRAGLEPVAVTTPGRLDVDIVRNRILDDSSLPVPRFARAVAAAPEATRHAFQQFLRDNRLSSHIQCLARKPA